MRPQSLSPSRSSRSVRIVDVDRLLRVGDPPAPRPAPSFYRALLTRRDALQPETLMHHAAGRFA